MLRPMSKRRPPVLAGLVTIWRGLSEGGAGATTGLPAIARGGYQRAFAKSDQHRALRDGKEPSNGQTESPPDDQPLHFARAFADLENLRVTVETRNRRLVDESVATEDLGGLAGGGHRGFGRVHLGHGGRLTERFAPVPEPGGLVREVAGVLDGNGHVGALEGDRLVASGRAPRC